VSELGEALRLKSGAPPVGITVRDTVVYSVRVPLTPLTVIAYVPMLVVEATARVRVEVPGPVIEAGLKVAVTPADKLMAESKAPVTVEVIVDAPLLPCTTKTEAG
jgi:hypothetical protein